MPCPTRNGIGITTLLAALLLTWPTMQLKAAKAAADTYHGTQVSDPFRWLEDYRQPGVRKWTEARNRETQRFLSGIPEREWLRAEFEKVLAHGDSGFSSLETRGDLRFFLRSRPPHPQPVLMWLKGTNPLETARVVLDPVKLDASGNTTIDWYVPSPDGRKLAVSISTNGTEWGTLGIWDVETGDALPDRIERVSGPTAGGSVTWSEKSRGLYYTRYPRPGERPTAELPFHQQVYFHELGADVRGDRYEIGKEFPDIAEVRLQSSEDARWVLATVANGDGGEFAHWLKSPRGDWKQITQFSDGYTVVQFGRDSLFVEWGRDEALYGLCYKNTPKGRIMRTPLSKPDFADGRTVLGESSQAIVEFAPTSSGLYVSTIEGGPMELRFHDRLAKTNRLVFPRRQSTSSDEPGPFVAISELQVSRGDTVRFRTDEFLDSPQYFKSDPALNGGRAESIGLEEDSPVSFGDIEVIRETALAKDGTKVPITLLKKRGVVLDGSQPTLLTGYGGFGISITAHYDAARRVWFDHGGLLVLAHLRGGGEWGEDWHQQGKLSRKQNVFSDFLTCADHLIGRGYATRSKLAIQGGSNGGLLMGAALTQRPELFRAVVSHVGIYDMLRVELDPKGAFNVTEFGSVRNADPFQALYGYSPYHRLVAGKDYPSVMLLTGENDGRANPAHSRKMAARLKEVVQGNRPVLLRTGAGIGHGAGKPYQARVEELADVYAFLFHELGIFVSRVHRDPWVGAVTMSSATLKAALVQPGVPTRLLVSTREDFRGARRTPTHNSAEATGNGVSFQLDSLSPNTRYHYMLEVDGRREPDKRGTFKTFPDGAGSFDFAFASCGKTGSTNASYDQIRLHQPLFYLNTGDYHYENIATNLPSRYREAYDRVFASPQQARLHRSLPIQYIWDDHDYGGNGSGRGSNSREAARKTYREVVPHYPLPAGDGDQPIYQSFAVGRTKFILTDLRSERDSVTNRDNAAKSMMGEKQKAWFKSELLSAKDRYPLIFWVSSVPWLGQRGSNYYPNVRSNYFGFIHQTNRAQWSAANRSERSDSTNATETGSAGVTNSPAGRRGPGSNPFTSTDEDHWSRYAHERAEIADFVKTNGISGLCILHGDAHMLAADDGRNGDFATGGGVKIPVLAAAPLDQDASIKGGPYSQGVYRVKKGEGAFGWIRVRDLGSRVEVSYRGVTSEGREVIQHDFSVPALVPGGANVTKSESPRRSANLKAKKP